MSTILVTGASGFVGRALCAGLLRRGGNVRGICRPVSAARIPPGVEVVTNESIDSLPDFRNALRGCDSIVHLAARVHVMRESEPDPLAAFRSVNVDGTLNLARQAAEVGVRRFVFISSIGVNGAETFETPFTADDEVRPHSFYAISKHEAEIGLRVLEQAGLEVVIIRPPLVYGPGASGNFERLMHWLKRGVPLPFGSIHNQRSFVSIDNLVDLISTCLTHSAAGGQTFLVSDGEDISTTDLLRRMGLAMGCPARLLPFPSPLIKMLAAMAGKADVAQRLCGSLQLDIEKTRRVLGWSPPFTLDYGLKKAATGSNA